MKFIKKTILLVSLLFVSFSLVGCSKGNPLSANQIMNDLKNAMNDTYSVDLIKELEQKEIDLNKEDAELLESKFDKKVDYKKLSVSFKMESMKVDVDAYYDLLYAYYNDEWMLLSNKKTNEDKWRYSFKETVDIIQIIDDLKEQTVEGFDMGFIGDAGKTTIKIDNQKTDKANSLDIIDISIDVKTDFASFTIPATVEYQFTKGDWVFKKISLNNELSWNVKYLVDEPQVPNKDEAIDMLTNKDSVLTYIAKKENISTFDFIGPNITANAKGVIANYDYYVKYDNIGSIHYHLKVPFNRIGEIWTRGELSVEIKDIDFKDMIGTWKLDDKNYFVFEKIDGNKIFGKYFEGENNFDFSCIVDLPNTPDEWILNLNSTKTLPDNKIKINTKDKNFLFNNQIYLKEKK